MCLLINSIFHTEYNKYREYKYFPKCFVADRDIHCVKVLQQNQLGIKPYFTPFQKSPVDFVNGVAEIKTNIKRRKYNFRVVIVCGKFYIYDGVHSLCYIQPEYLTLNNVECKDAIIPKGTKFYVGNNKDIVSEKLLVFENEGDYKKYKEGKEIFDMKQNYQSCGYGDSRMAQKLQEIVTQV